ncbi:nuclear transport factor 2 family protein [Dactylosporangium vinaceum]|uniref:Nuclear transport factor 2 family protein n=1 Tax=Dactylosporangium vinaceum TaxID=53362 RepID=A0ABV5MS58_9ACTN|nr:nuclear transport factor 2 family protein [Dactylosporangium vinaceum]UAC00257.1 nuclear transport factor 2 family protein [Dactylosporangium vinaceum]
MTEQMGAALRIALAYHEAWTGKDLDRAMSYVAGNVVCDAPAGRIEGAVAYRAFMAPFVQMLLGATVIAAFGDERTAVVVYDTATVAVASGPAAESVTVEDGKITYSRFIFDRVPFQQARERTSGSV